MDLIETINTKLKEYYESCVRKSPRYTTWASEAGHPCLRYLVLCRTQWEKIPGLGAEIQPRLEVGRAIHRMDEETFRAAGFEVFTSPDSLHDAELEVSGRMDFEISLNGRGKDAVPVEVKSVQEWDLQRYNSIEDLLKGSWWNKKYVAQLALYCWLRSKEQGILRLRSLKSYKNLLLSILDPKIIDFVNDLLDNLKKVKEFVANKEIPDPIPFNEQICSRCSAQSICMPDTPISKGEVLIDEEMEEQVDRRQELAPLVTEFDKLDKIIKIKVEGKPNIVVGDWQITGKWIEGIREAKPGGSFKYWKKKITKVAKGTSS